MKRNIFVSSVFVILIISTFTKNAFATTNTTIHIFWAEGCPHCAHEKEFLSNYIKKNPNVVIKDYEITKNQENLNLLKDVGQSLHTEVAGVPFTVIGDKYIVGFQDVETTGSEINTLVQQKNNDDVVYMLANARQKTKAATQVEDKNVKISRQINLPLIGTVETKHMSLPTITFVIALLDGFNPCAMWTLLFLISLLLGMQNKKRMWILGSTFIVASGLVYFLFLSAWLNLFLFLGFIVWIRLAVAFIALFAGYYYLWDFWQNRDGACKIKDNQKHRYIFEKLKTLALSQNFIFAIFGVALLGVAVNMVELICSAGLPAVYTNILSLSNLPKWQYYGYLIFYIIVFMIDDLFVFVTAMITLKSTHADSKYTRYSHLIGGILMAIIGVLLIFKPGWLMFG